MDGFVRVWMVNVNYMEESLRDTREVMLAIAYAFQLSFRGILSIVYDSK